MMAKLEENHKSAIIGLHGVGQYAKELIEKAERQAIKYEWNNESKNWLIREINEKEKDEIIRYKKIIFNTYMNPLQARAILSRNKKGNYIIDAILGIYGNNNAETLKEKTQEMLKDNEGEKQ